MAEVNLSMTSYEANILLKVLDDYTEKNYNEIASIVFERLRDLLLEI